MKKTEESFAKIMVYTEHLWTKIEFTWQLLTYKPSENNSSNQMSSSGAKTCRRMNTDDHTN
jgi:hypothetical protein